MKDCDGLRNMPKMSPIGKCSFNKLEISADGLGKVVWPRILFSDKIPVFSNWDYFIISGELSWWDSFSCRAQNRRRFLETRLFLLTAMNGQKSIHTYRINYGSSGCSSAHTDWKQLLCMKCFGPWAACLMPYIIVNTDVQLHCRPIVLCINGFDFSLHNYSCCVNI